MKVAVLSVALLFTILLSPLADAWMGLPFHQDRFRDGFKTMIHTGWRSSILGDIIGGEMNGQGEIKASQAKKSEPPVADQVVLLLQPYEDISGGPP
ncbi:hypothetical protein BTVI_69159 [Pitangus sulphuratus]|nr:hypothetical protein BTVI_69159 [Pitangus sulphuratus]